MFAMGTVTSEHLCTRLWRTSLETELMVEHTSAQPARAYLPQQAQNTKNRRMLIPWHWQFDMDGYMGEYIDEDLDSIPCMMP